MALSKKLFYGGAWLTIAAALFSILTVTYWSVAPYRGLYDVPQPFVVTTNPVEVGQLVSYTVRYCVDEKLPLPITVSREMELQGPGNLLFPLSPNINYQITQRCETRTLAFGIANYVPPGTYHVHYNTDLKVNPVREIQQQFISADFVVVPSKVLEHEAVEAAELLKNTAKTTATDLAKPKK